jgi:hypothetical protein
VYLSSYREKTINKIIEMQKVLFIPIHVDSFEELNKLDDNLLQLSFKSTENLFIEQSGRSNNDFKR